MLTKQSVENYIDAQPVLLKQCFTSLLDNKSKTTQETIDSFLEPTRLLLIAGGIPVSPTDNWLSELNPLFDDITPVMHILQGESKKVHQTLRGKVIKLTLGWIFDNLLGYCLDLDYRHLGKSDRLLVGDAIFLSAIYKKLTV